MRAKRAPAYEAAALFEKSRAIDPVPDVTRARTLVRARARLATLGAEPAIEQAVRHLPWQRVAMAAVVAVGLVATGAVAARVTRPPTVELLASTADMTPDGARTVVIPPRLPASGDEPAPPSDRRERAEPPAQGRGREFALMRQAQAAYASEDYPTAIHVLLEHAARYPSGRLAEEREALRVRTLLGLRRPDEARRALDAFEGRFSQSVLLPSLRRAIGQRT